MKRKHGPVYRPTGVYRVVVGIAATFFGVLCAVLVLTGAGTLWVIAGGLMVGISVLGVVEVFVTEVVLGPEEVTIRRLFTRRAYPYADLTEARIDGPSLAVRLEGREWVRFPDWLTGGQAMSLRKLLGARIAAAAGRADEP